MNRKIREAKPIFLSPMFSQRPIEGKAYHNAFFKEARLLVDKFALYRSDCSRKAKARGFRALVILIAAFATFTFLEQSIVRAQSFSSEFIQTTLPGSEGDEGLKQIKRAIAALPPGVVKEIEASGVHIKLVSTLVDYRPELAGKQPPGYKEGQDYSHMDAQYRGGTVKEILVAAKVARKTDDFVLNNRVGSATLHEFGHAYDQFANFPSRSEAFMALYQQDSARLNSAQIEKDHYYLQSGRRGPREIFAELFLFAFHEKAGLRVRHANLPVDFPGCCAFVRDLTSRLQ